MKLLNFVHSTNRHCELACAIFGAEPSAAIQLNNSSRSDFKEKKILLLRNLFNWVAAHALAPKGARLLAMTVLLWSFALSFLSTPLSAKSAHEFIEEVEDLQQQASAGDVKTTAISPADAPYRPADRQELVTAPTVDARNEILVQQLQERVQQLTGKVEELEHKLSKLQGHNPAPAKSTVTESLKPVSQDVPADPVISARDATIKTLGTVAPEVVEETVAHRAAPVLDEPEKAKKITSYTYPEGAKAHYDYAYNLVTSSDFPGAQAAFEAFIDKYPSHELAGAAEYWWGDTYYSEKKYEKAAKKFLLGYQQYKKSPKAPDMLLKLAMTLENLGEKKKACTTLSKLKTEYPKANVQVLEQAGRLQQHLKCKE